MHVDEGIQKKQNCKDSTKLIKTLIQFQISGVENGDTGTVYPGPGSL